MRTTRHLLIALGFIFVLPVLASAQTGAKQPDPLELLQDVQVTYGAMTSFSAKATTHMEMSGTGMQSQTSMAMTLQLDSSGRMRMESDGPIGMTVVNDGTNVWTYMPQANQYIKMPVASSESGGSEGSVPFSGMDGFWGELKNVAKNVKEAKVLRSETVQANGTKVPCWVISVEYEPTERENQAASAQTSSSQSESTQGGAAEFDGRSGPNANTKTLWIGKINYLVYRTDRTDTTSLPKAMGITHFNVSLRYDNIAVDQPIPQSAFTFTPPSGATEMQIPSPGKTPSKQP